MYRPNGLLDYAPVGLESGQRGLHLLRQSLELVQVGVEYLNLSALFRMSYVARADHGEIVVALVAAAGVIVVFDRVFVVEGVALTVSVVVDALVIVAEGVVVSEFVVIDDLVVVAEVVVVPSIYEYVALTLRQVKGRRLRPLIFDALEWFCGTRTRRGKRSLRRWGTVSIIYLSISRQSRDLPSGLRGRRYILAMIVSLRLRCVEVPEVEANERRSVTVSAVCSSDRGETLTARFCRVPETKGPIPSW